MSTAYVFSTLANDQNYTNWLKGGGDVPIKGHNVIIKGGTGVANNRLITPLGVATEVTEFDLEELNKNSCFLEHQKTDMFVFAIKKWKLKK